MTRENQLNLNCSERQQHQALAVTARPMNLEDVTLDLPVHFPAERAQGNVINVDVLDNVNFVLDMESSTLVAEWNLPPTPEQIPPVDCTNEALEAFYRFTGEVWKAQEDNELVDQATEALDMLRDDVIDPLGFPRHEKEIRALEELVGQKLIRNELQNVKSKKQNILSIKTEENRKKPPFHFQHMSTYRANTTLEKAIDIVALRSNIGGGLEEWLRTKCAANRKAATFGGCDVDLVYKLKSHAAFQTRSMQLATTLKNRCMKYLDEYDLSKWTEREKYDLMMYAVCEAMVVDKMELMLFERLKEEAASYKRFKEGSSNF